MSPLESDRQAFIDAIVYLEKNPKGPERDDLLRRLRTLVEKMSKRISWEAEKRCDGTRT